MWTGGIHSDDRYNFVDTTGNPTPDQGSGEGYDGCPTPYDDSDFDNNIEDYWVEVAEDGNDTVIAKDNTTGLYWTESLDCNVQGYNQPDITNSDNRWENARNLCAGLGDIYTEPSNESEHDSSWGEHGHFNNRDYDWRLPTKNELMQVAPENHDYDYSGGNDMKGWNEDFAFGISGINYGYRYWSQNERSDLLSRASTVGPYDGIVHNISKTYEFFNICVRCVSRYQ